MSELDTVKRIRAKYPRSNPGGAPLGEDHWICLVEVAQALGLLLFKKDGGDHVFIPPLGVFASRTILGRGTLGNRWVKVFSDGEGAAGPIWNLGETPADGTYLDVRGITLPGDPPPPTGDLEARVTALEKRVSVIEQKPDPIAGRTFTLVPK